MENNNTVFENQLVNFKPVKKKQVPLESFLEQDLLFPSTTINPEGPENKESKLDRNVSVFDCAAYILSRTGTITTMKLHKLLYYSQAWSLVWDESPIFNQEIQAWANGPVIPILFSFHRGYYYISSVSIGNLNLLSNQQKETIDSVLAYYGDKPSQWLIQLTHLEDPWKNARIGLSTQERGKTPITLESMAEYYSALL